MLNPQTPGVTADALGNGYVTSDGNGGFTITGDYVCPNPASQVYLLASGGNPGLAAGTNNFAITMIAALGNCGALLPTTQININELSTVASVTALQQFMVDSTHIGTSASNALGLQNAFLSVPNIETLASGTARSASLLGNGSVPATKINTIADILAPCVNSLSAASSACTSLFAAATPTGGSAPLDIATAMLSIATHANSKVPALFSQITPAAPFLPSLSAAPNDYTIGVTYTGGGLSAPGLVVIDAAGDAWTANCPNCQQPGSGTDSLVGFGPQGAVLSGATGYTTNIHMPQGIGFDTLGNLWSVDVAAGATPDQIVKMSSSGVVATGFPYTSPALAHPLGIALDQAGNAWITNQNLNSALKIGPSGTTVAGPVTSPGFFAPSGIGIDGNGIIFAAGAGSSSILKFNSTGTVLSGPGKGFTGAGINVPISIALDSGDHVWSVNNQNNSISEIFGQDGTPISGPGGYTGGLYQTSFISIAGDGTVWIADCRVNCPNEINAPDNVLHYNVNGTILNQGTSTTVVDGFQDTNLSTVGTTAIDKSGNLWVTNNTGGSLTKFLGIAAPVVTPLAQGIAANQLGTRP